MPSLSSYDLGKKAAEGKRLTADFEAGKRSVVRLMKHWTRYKSYKPRLIFTEGNHEERIKRYENDYPHLAGSLPRPLDFLADKGWECYPFLRVAWVDQVAYSHFFAKTSGGTTNGASTRNGASNAKAQIKNNMVSCVAGHKQGLDIAHYDALHKRLTAIIAGSCYLHKEGYKGEQGNDEWRGIVHLHNVHQGTFEPERINLKRLKKRYGK